MANKDRERFFVQRLQHALPELVSLEVMDWERPDFLLRGPDGLTGLEVTELFLPPAPEQRPPQEQQALRDRVVQLALRDYVARGGPPLEVMVTFSDRPLRKRQVPDAAARLAAAVRLIDAPRNAWVRAVDHLPDEVLQIRVACYDFLDESHWTDAPPGGWVVDVDPVLLQDRITAKAGEMAAYAEVCDRCWLLIAFDQFSGGTPLDVGDKTLAARYQSPFARTLLLEAVGARAFDLQSQR